MTAILKALLGALLVLWTPFLSGGALAGPEDRALGLDPNRLAVTSDQHMLLKYLVSCALPKDVAFQAEVDGRSTRFHGALGLAPNWLHRGLTTSEQRWVSACILARTNHFGKEVAISMRARAPAPDSLRATPEEAAQFTLAEGGFFGNIFAEHPVAYVCSGERSQDDGWKDRVCAEPSGATLAAGQAVTHCGFIHLGTCDRTDLSSVGAESYRVIIFVYLKPSGQGNSRRSSFGSDAPWSAQCCHRRRAPLEYTKDIGGNHGDLH